MTNYAPPTSSFSTDGGPPDAETLVRRVVEIVSNAKSMPLSASVLISKDEVVELLEDALSKFPEELRQARWMLKERSEFLAKVQREGDEILDSARVRAEQMVQRTEIVREAKTAAQRTIDDARAESSRLRNEAEDYCDQKLAQFEIILDRTINTVRAGRDKLRVAPLPQAEEPVARDAEDAGFFDQDA